MVLLGVLGFGMRRAGVPVLPLVIGFVLGNLAEKSFLLTLRIHDGSYLGFFDRRHLLDPHPHDGGGGRWPSACAPADETAMKRVNYTYVIVKPALPGGGVSLVVALSLGFEGQGGLVPVVLGVPTLALILFSLGRELLLTRAPPRTTPWTWRRGPLPPPSSPGWGSSARLVLLIGFQLTIPIYVVLFLRSYGRTSWPACAIAAFSVWVLVYVCLELLLHRTLFEGVLFGAILPLL